MSATNLTTLAEHIAEHDLAWSNITAYRSNLQVQLGSRPDALVRWLSTLGAVVWSVQDCRQHDDDGDGFWAVYVTGDLDGDVRVWCDVPADFASTAEAVEQRMRDLAAAAATVDA